MLTVISLCPSTSRFWKRIPCALNEHPVVSPESGRLGDLLEMYWKGNGLYFGASLIRYIIESVEGQIHKKQSTRRQYPKCIYILNKFPMEVCGPYHFPEKSLHSLECASLWRVSSLESLKSVRPFRFVYINLEKDFKIEQFLKRHTGLFFV